MKKILLIEDNSEVRENTAEILMLSNYDVETAENGKIGVKKALEVAPDIIICDIMMPELDGYGVLHALQRNPSTASIPFIFLTAKAEKTDFRKGMNLGADDYVTKPFEDAELLDIIETRLKKSEGLKQQISDDGDSLDKFIEAASNFANLEDLLQKCETRPYQNKSMIYVEGSYPHYLFFVKKGKVKTFKTNPDAKELITALNKEGDYFGYMSLLLDQPYDESAETIEDTELTLVPKEEFFKILDQNHEVSARFIKLISKDALDKEKQLLQIAYDSIRLRVAAGLIKFYHKYEQSEDGIPIVREDLANVVGTSPETVIRTLRDFKDENLIQIEGRKIKIIEPEKLANLKY